MKTINITAHTTDDSQIEALETTEAFMKASKIDFELSKVQSPYNSEFVKKIQQGDKDLKNKKGRSVSLEELDDL